MKDKKPWGFCETPEEKCTMNYCDDNGCQNRKRNNLDVNDSLDSTSYMIQRVFDKIVEEINTQKQLIIKQKIKEILGIEIDLKEESKRRFKRFGTITIGNEETIYFNDGSIEGKRIVTFVKNKIPQPLEKLNLKYEENNY